MFQYPATTVCKQNTEKEDKQASYIEICAEKAACKEKNCRPAFRWQHKIAQGHNSQKYREKKRYKHLLYTPSGEVNSALL